MLPVGPGVLKPNGHGPVLNQPSLQSLTDAAQWCNISLVGQ